MSATNSTPNYELPIFEATDKPTWQGDFNEAMNKIDVAIGGVEEKADNNNTQISNLRQSVNNLSGSVNSLNTQVGNINTNLENKVIILSQSNVVNPDSVTMYSGSSANIYYNVNAIQFLGTFDIVNLNGSILVNNQYRTPLISVPRNIFNLSSSTINDNNNKYVLSTSVCLYNTKSSSDILTVRAYYDGNNTILYATTEANVLPVISFALNVTTLNAGLVD